MKKSEIREFNEKLDKTFMEMGFHRVPADIINTVQYHLIENRILPKMEESKAIAPGIEKTAALFYDKIWCPFPFIVPNEFRFSTGNEFELSACLSIITELEKNPVINGEKIYKLYVDDLSSVVGMIGQELLSGLGKNMQMH